MEMTPAKAGPRVRSVTEELTLPEAPILTRLGPAGGEDGTRWQRCFTGWRCLVFISPALAVSSLLRAVGMAGYVYKGLCANSPETTTVPW